VKVNIRIESEATTDKYVRAHAKSIDKPLDDTGHWQETQPDYFLGYAGGSFTHEQTVELKPGWHYVEYAVSGYVPDYAWHAKIYLNDKLVAEGDVGRKTHLRVKFIVGLRRLLTLPSPLLPGRRYIRCVTT